VGITPESIARLLKVVRGAKTVFQVGQQLRSDPQLRAAIERVHGGEFGKIIMVKARRHSSNDLSHGHAAAEGTGRGIQAKPAHRAAARGATHPVIT
jgi:predicted dehydrogenase